MPKIEKFDTGLESRVTSYNDIILVDSDTSIDVSTSAPSHYSRLTPQTIQRLQDVLSDEEFQGFCRGNVIKYAERMRYKDEPSKEAKKIIDYAKWLYQSLKGEKITID